MKFGLKSLLVFVTMIGLVLAVLGLYRELRNEKIRFVNVRDEGLDLTHKFVKMRAELESANHILSVLAAIPSAGSKYAEIANAGRSAENMMASRVEFNGEHPTLAFFEIREIPRWTNGGWLPFWVALVIVDLKDNQIISSLVLRNCDNIEMMSQVMPGKFRVTYPDGKRHEYLVSADSIEISDENQTNSPGVRRMP